MQPCFFALAKVLPSEQAIALIKDSIEKSYGKRGSQVVERNHKAIDLALASLAQVPVPEAATNARTEAVIARSRASSRRSSAAAATACRSAR